MCSESGLLSCSSPETSNMAFIMLGSTADWCLKQTFCFDSVSKVTAESCDTPAKVSHVLMETTAQSINADKHLTFTRNSFSGLQNTSLHNCHMTKPHVQRLISWLADLCAHRGNGRHRTATVKPWRHRAHHRSKWRRRKRRKRRGQNWWSLRRQ